MTDSRSRRRPGRAAKLGFLGGSLIASLVVAELAARLWHRGAYPFLHRFRADPAYGVRLEPEVEMRLRSRSGRITTARTNSLGFRGPEWRAGGVLVLGDSQVFGYGVEYGDSLAARLPGGMAAAVPSWGPAEYVRALSEHGPRLRPRAVVFVANAANDWFETAVPNTKRTTARDGWAMRWRADAEPARWFPGRSLVLGRSHLVLALRQLSRHARFDGEMPISQSAIVLERDARELRRGTGRFRSRLTPFLVEAERLCREIGCRLVAAALPLDVQVAPAEWKKYRAGTQDMGRSEALLDDFVADARDLGIPAVNLLPLLRAAEPGAFLDDDYHLSPRGHAVVAGALAPLCDGPAAAGELALGGRP